MIPGILLSYGALESLDIVGPGVGVEVLGFKS